MTSGTTDNRIRLGYQIPNFTYPDPLHGVRGPDSDIFPSVLAQARDAQDSGFDTVFVMDHFFQLPGIGAFDEPMLEAYTALGALATGTSSIKLSTLVSGNTYRNPALLAKAVTTLDAVSGGRAVLGIGAGWFEREHDAMGYEFGTFTDRFAKLSEALTIIEPMLRGGRPEVDGEYYSSHGAFASPLVRTDLPIMLGGAGEKKTFALAARYADHINMNCSPDEIPRKLDALAARCEEAGRDRSTLETSLLGFVMMDEDGDVARAMVGEYLRKLGTDPATLDDETFARATARMFVGTPDDVAEQIQTRVLDRGLDGIVFNMVANGHVPGMVRLAGETLAPLFR
ncbi:LLM class F420-dependent oxidoreductase [Gordonia sp. PP30]|uniref:LLM class F420-dependent oxidoreductase n=1 Tax=Gordonia sp. PP30 TaxID=2935861 RepID=UPI001FFF4226|nr:LLM class F420-dependent oxidoreductase [Gordonia sp. PP30]UQE76196.1 LLM class F420-dependent oxidoreductase [Gordonia sp. PP30]